MKTFFVSHDYFAYLLCERNLPVECPEPSHPGIGHLCENLNKFKLYAKCVCVVENEKTLEALSLGRHVVYSLVCWLADIRTGCDVTNSYRSRGPNHRIRVSDI